MANSWHGQNVSPSGPSAGVLEAPNTSYSDCWLHGKLPEASAAACSLRNPVPGIVLGPELVLHLGLLAVASQMSKKLEEGLSCHPHRMAWSLRSLMWEL